MLVPLPFTRGATVSHYSSLFSAFVIPFHICGFFLYLPTAQVADNKENVKDVELRWGGGKFAVISGMTAARLPKDCGNDSCCSRTRAISKFWLPVSIVDSNDQSFVDK